MRSCIDAGIPASEHRERIAALVAMRNKDGIAASDTGVFPLNSESDIGVSGRHLPERCVSDGLAKASRMPVAILGGPPFPGFIRPFPALDMKR
jgi:hypothetical protein